MVVRVAPYQIRSIRTLRKPVPETYDAVPCSPHLWAGQHLHCVPHTDRQHELSSVRFLRPV